MRPRLLDLFCGAGGAGMGYHRAGFDVVGVDIEPQPDYPFEFHQADALVFLTEHAGEFDALHGSPPCQAFTPLSALPHAGRRNPVVDLVKPTRDAFIRAGLPWAIENVVQAPIAHESDLFGSHGVILCGTMFDLTIYRHRKFETSFTVPQPPHPLHRHLAMRAGYLPTEERPFMSIHGRNGHNSRAWVVAAAAAMGTPWMTSLNPVCEAIPPAYTEFVGRRLLDALSRFGNDGPASVDTAANLGIR